MKKLMTILAALTMFAATAALAADRYTGSITIPALATSGAVTQNLFKADNQYYNVATEIGTVMAAVTTGTSSNSAVVTFSTFEHGEAQAFATSTALNGGGDWWDCPAPLVQSVTHMPFVVSTNSATAAVVFYKPYTNQLVRAGLGYIARQLIIEVSQSAVDTATVINYTILTKDDPPGLPAKK